MGTIQAKDLNLGDMIRFPCGEFCDALVFRINLEEQTVTVRRPYMAHSSFSVSGSGNGMELIPYVGTEDVKLNFSTLVTRIRIGSNIK